MQDSPTLTEITSVEKLALDRRFGDYFAKTLRAHGATYLGVDWKSETAQTIRFEQLSKLFETKEDFSVNDLGCGYGALYSYMIDQGYARFDYLGYDLSKDMIDAARKHLKDQDRVHLIIGSSLEIKDYTVASGIFDLKLDLSESDWQEHVLETVAAMAKASTRGFAFNCRTKYSDPEFIKEQVYYGNPCILFDWCKTNISRRVALLHDYEAYDFTIIVRLT